MYENEGGAVDTSWEGSIDTYNTGNNSTDGKTALIQQLTDEQETEMEKILGLILR